MTNKTISALSSASTIVGTEVLPIVQSSATVKVSVANLTSGLGTIIATKGGTGQTSYSVGDIIYSDTITTLAKLGIGAANYVLTSSGTVPQYVAQSTLSVGSATNATNTAITDDTTTATTVYPTWVTATTGNLPQKTASTKLSFVPSTGTLTATSHAGAWAGSTIGTNYGGTGLTSFTANGVVYASSTSALSTGSALTFDGTNLNTKGITTAGTTYSTGNVTLDSAQIFRSGATGIFGLDPAFSVSSFSSGGNVTSIAVTTTRQAGLLIYGGTWSGNANSTYAGVALVLAGGSGVSVVNISQTNQGGYGNPTITTSGYVITITNPSSASGSIQGCFVGSTVA